MNYKIYYICTIALHHFNFSRLPYIPGYNNKLCNLISQRINCILSDISNIVLNHDTIAAEANNTEVENY